MQAKKEEVAMIENYLTVSDAARVLNRTGEAVRHYERTGQLAAIRTVGGVRLFKQADVENFKQKLKARKWTRKRRTALNRPEVTA
jgi:excisionase family DNA binding protein